MTVSDQPSYILIADERRTYAEIAEEYNNLFNEYCCYVRQPRLTPSEVMIAQTILRRLIRLNEELAVALVIERRTVRKARRTLRDTAGPGRGNFSGPGRRTASRPR